MDLCPSLQSLAGQLPRNLRAINEVPCLSMHERPEGGWRLVLSAKMTDGGLFMHSRNILVDEVVGMDAEMRVEFCRRLVAEMWAELGQPCLAEQLAVARESLQASAEDAAKIKAVPGGGGAGVRMVNSWGAEQRVPGFCWAPDGVANGPNVRLVNNWGPDHEFPTLSQAERDAAVQRMQNECVIDSIVHQSHAMAAIDIDDHLTLRDDLPEPDVTGEVRE